LYTQAEAGRLLGVPPVTVHRWLLGYSYAAREARGRWQRSVASQEPVVLRDEDEDFRFVTFVDLVELLMIEGFRKAGVSLQRVRVAAETAASLFAVTHPLAFMRFKTDGRDVFADVQEREGLTGLVNLSRRGQKVFPEAVEMYLRQLEYDVESGLASRWWPHGKDGGVAVDPHIAFGAPHIFGQGVPTSALYEMVEAGDSTESVARWFKVQPSDVEAAVKYERELRAA
jgi:uncharacterized protein (DUF433 family)